MHEYIMHHKFYASISYEETTNVSNCVPTLSIPITSYVLPTCIDCKHVVHRKSIENIKVFVVQIKKLSSDSPVELYNLFTSKKP